MKTYSISEAHKRDAEATPNSTDFTRTIETIANGMTGAERRAFVAGAIAAAELCGKHIFAFHILSEQWK